MDALEVIQPGAFTTVQDLGRYGYQKYGVSPSGAMDRFALRVANLLAGNEEGEAAIEATLLGPRLRALAELRVAFTGADLSPAVDGRPVAMWRAVRVARGSVLSFGAPRSGCRAYLAIGGGIDFPVVMGSRSIHVRSGLGGDGRALAGGDVIKIKDPGDRGEKSEFPVLPAEFIPVYGRQEEVRVLLGPQADSFTRKGIETFLSSSYEITPQADRMGYRLKGPKVEHRSGADILTDGTPPGSIQVPGDGQPIILLADGQTTGGYAKIAVVASVDLDLLGQARPGDKVRFRRILLPEAHRLIREMEKRMERIREAMALS